MSSLPPRTPMPPTEVTVKNDGTRTYVDALAAEFTRHHEFQIQTIADPATAETGVLAVVPDGKKLVSVKPFIDEYLLRPRRRKGQARVKDADSFVALATRFASSNSLVFANPAREKPQFLAVLDYHPESVEATDADWCEHKVLYEPALSDEWLAWTGQAGKPMGQADFAAFLEDRISDVLDTSVQGDDAELIDFAKLAGGFYASPSALIGLSRGLALRVDATVRSAVTLNTGEIDIAYSEVHNDAAFGGKLTVANLFVVAIPVFYNGPKYRLVVRLRYRVQDQKVRWFYQIVRPEASFDDAFQGVVSEIRKATNLGVILGSPEA